MAGMTALVVGAAGLVGGELLRLLLAAPEYDGLIVWGRRPCGIVHEKLQEVMIDFDALPQYVIPESVQQVFCCLGTTIKKAKSQAAFRQVDLEYPLLLAEKAKAAGVKQFLIISAAGAAVNSLFFYGRVKGELEEKLKKLQLPGLHIFQPTLLLGERKEFRLGERVLAAVLSLIPFALLGPLQRLQPIAAKTVAAAMLQAAIADQPGVHVYSAADMVDLCKNRSP